MDRWTIFGPDIFQKKAKRPSEFKNSIKKSNLTITSETTQRDRITIQRFSQLLLLPHCFEIGPHQRGNQIVRFLIILPKVFHPLVAAQSIRCYKFKASANEDEYDIKKFIPNKFLIQENLQQCEKGVTHCIMIKGNIKNDFHNSQYWWICWTRNWQIQWSKQCQLEIQFLNKHDNLRNNFTKLSIVL